MIKEEKRILFSREQMEIVPEKNGGIIMTTFSQPNRQVFVSLIGISAAILTGLVLGLIEFYSGLALYSFSVWVIIPVGSILAGFVAGSGFYLGATQIQQKPLGGVFLNVLIASVSAFFIVYYVPYFLTEINGKRIKDFISFGKYFEISVTHTSVSLIRAPSASTGKLGDLGYLYALLQLIGFSLGGIYVFFWLSQVPYCKKCSRYLGKKYHNDRYASDADQMIAMIQDIKSALSNNDFQKAITLHAETGGDQKIDHHLRARIIARICPGCGINHFDFVVSKLEKDSWKDITDSKISLFTNQQIIA